MKTIYYILIVAILSSIMVVSPASAKTWNVDTSQEILDALNNCADGDTIFVMNGVYDIDENKIIEASNVTFKGESRDGVIIKSNNQILCVGNNEPATNCVIENFTGMTKTAGQKPTGIEIYCSGCIVQNVAINVPILPITIESDDCIVRNCVFDGCYEAGIDFYGENNTFKNNIVSNSTSTYSLYIENTVTKTIIENNIFNNCNPVYLNGENSTVANNTFLNSQGGAITFDSTTAKNNTIVRNNIGSNGVAINFVNNAGNGNKIFLNNFANTSGGMSGTPPTITYWNSTEPMEYTYNGTTHTGYLGNFWGTAYTGSDGDGNGIGDISYTVPSSFGTDYAPLISPNENYGSSETPETPSAPVAGFSATPTSGDAPLTVNFTDQSTNTPTSWLWDFGDNSTATEQNPSHIYTAAGNYTVNLTVSNAGGSDSEVKTEYIIVSEPLPGAPVANFTANVTSGTAPLTVEFTDISTGSPTSWQWDFNNDGIVDSTEQTPVYTYSTVGNYTVNLMVSNAGGNDSEVKTDYIVVSEPLPGAPVADFAANQTIGTAPFDVQCTDASTGTVYSYSWDFDNDGIVDSSEQNPVHTYVAPGKYTVNLTVTGPGGSDSEVKTGYIKVTVSSPGKPVAAFSASSASGKTPLTVAFTDRSSNMPTKWKWSFGDGASSTIQNPKHKYSKAGKYTVTLTVTNAKGSNTITETDYIKVISKPAANFTSSVTSGKVPVNVKFTDTSTGTPSGWIWEFGDGSKSFVENPTHKYSKAGTYTVNLTVKNAAGSNIVTKTEHIKVIAKPVAEFSATPTSGKTPLTVAFTDASTGSPTKWKWSFGDGTSSTIQNPKHKYSKTGSYTVTLTSTNAAGISTTTKTDYIKVTTNTK
jgi:parallel beta-helix repeat protein